MPSFFRTLAALSAVSFAQVSASTAAEVSHKCKNDFCIMQLKGDIESGDAEQFARILAELNENGNAARRLILLSNGGDVEEALRIGRIVREAFIFTTTPFGNTYIPPMDRNLIPGTQKARDALSEHRKNTFEFFEAVTVDDTSITSSGKAAEIITASGRTLQYDKDAVCASACALIAISGLYRYGTVGLHHMYVNNDEVDYDELDAILSQSTGEVSGFLNEMRAPASFLQDIVATPSKEIKWVNLYEIGSFDPILQEYTYSKCGGLTENQSATKLELELIEMSGKDIDIEAMQVVERSLTAAERKYLQQLQEIAHTSSKCIEALHLDAQRKAQGLD